MRKIFIALFLIFFAHCECVLGGAPSQGGSGEIVEGGGELVNCNLDQYRYNGECEDCPPGTTTSSTTSTTVEDCKLCKAGYYRNFFENSYELCVTGNRCPGGIDCVIHTCGPGTYQDEEGQDSCKTCEKGYYCANSINEQQEKCPTGSTTSGAGAKSKNDCYVCDPGYYYSESNSVCTKCMINSSYCPGGDKAKAVPCPPGTGIPTGVEGISEDDCQYDEHKCKNQDGYYVNNEKCDICPAGYYCPAGLTDRELCPPETPISDPGSGEISNCRAITKCADVAFVAGCGGSDDNTARIKTCRNMAGCYWNETEKKCADCPEGSYCTNCSEKAIGCPTGTTTSGLGAKQKSDCYLKYNKLKQNDTEIKIPSMSDPHATQPYTGHLYFYSTVPENCPPASAVCPAPDGTGGVAGGIVSQK